jgi:hypothetical protein
VKSVAVNVRRTGRRFDADATFDAAADLDLVWTTLTDYGQLPNFMPGIRACKVVQRKCIGPGREQLQVQQHGEFRFLLFAQALTVHLDVLHERHRSALARATRFDLGVMKGRALEAFEGCYELQPLERGVRVLYRAVIVSRLPPPPGIGAAAVRANLAGQLNAVAAEIERRRAAIAA